jgi:NAD(P)-dependent dehydrogenase (short-subunit alcohol dehydrogenase family)
MAQQIRDEGGQATALAADLRDEASLERMVHTTAELFGGLDAVHINAADFTLSTRDTNAIDVDLEVFDRVIATELRGHFLCTRHALPALLARGGGAIVYSGSYAGIAGFKAASASGLVAYTMAKHAQVGLMRHVAKTWGDKGVRANVIAVGSVPGEGQAQRLGDEGMRRLKASYLQRAHSDRVGTPEDIAAMVALLASDDGRWINGQVIPVDGGISMR